MVQFRQQKDLVRFSKCRSIRDAMIPETTVEFETYSATVDCFSRPAFRQRVKEAHAVCVIDESGLLTIIHGRELLLEIGKRASEWDRVRMVGVAIKSDSCEIEFVRSAVGKIKGGRELDRISESR